ncbi:hypothetical protein CQW23_08377 [Capsicum baccatum]|uniref:Uncharacterized protein n=1 Tax=Capsicum baccatum TaxID=33114 RepID=A0A2G2X8U2_CAPBA|nr:hypothetical protein CQW23_08377 [Capsicum baccatum]
MLAEGGVDSGKLLRTISMLAVGAVDGGRLLRINSGRWQDAEDNINASGGSSAQHNVDGNNNIPGKAGKGRWPVSDRSSAQMECYLTSNSVQTGYSGLGVRVSIYQDHVFKKIGANSMQPYAITSRQAAHSSETALNILLGQLVSIISCKIQSKKCQLLESIC